LRIESRARRLVVDGRDKVVARRRIGEPRCEATRHLVDPGSNVGSLRVVDWNGIVGDRPLQTRDHRARKLFLDLRARERETRTESDQRDDRKCGAEARNPATPHCLLSLPLTNPATSPTGTGVAAASRRAWYSTLPSFRPRSPIVTRWGIPISS